MRAGIEALNIFGGSVYFDVNELAEARKLDSKRFANLLMKEKSVCLPCEDAVTFGVNAAKPIIDSLTKEEKNSIEMVISCSESGIDFGKSMSTYIHHYLGLQPNCRLFEVKQACYSGVAGLQQAINFVLAGVSPGAKVLVIATDITRFIAPDDADISGEDWAFAEPSNGAGAVAALVGDNPTVFSVDIGANGYYGYEVMDACRPETDMEAADADLSLMSYLDCCEYTFKEYQKRIEGVSYKDSFNYLAFHTPFGGMVKGAHRTMMRRVMKAKPAEIESDFQERVMPGLSYCQRVGNVMGATTLLSLASTIDNGNYETPKRVGCYSYGSGCSAEFFSGIVTPEGQQRQAEFSIQHQLDNRYRLTMDEYEALLRESSVIRFGTKNRVVDYPLSAEIISAIPQSGRLYLKQINDYHRVYEWV